MAWDLINTKSISGLKHGAFKKILKKSDGAEVWSAGSTVTYLVDIDVSYVEEVDNGASCLAPSSFTPTKSGWTFVGWREDNAANSSVLSNKVMGTDPITLYAVYQKTITVTYYDNSTTAKTATGIVYYNAAGNTDNPEFTLTQTAISGWTARGWSTSTTANASVKYTNATEFTSDSDITLYGLYQKTVTLTYYNNSTTAKESTGTVYRNHAGTVIRASFTLTQTAVSGWTARGWSTGTAGNSAVTYNNATSFTILSDVTVYGMYQKTVTLSYDGNSATSGSTASQTGTAYRNYAGTVIGASITLRTSGFTRTYYKFIKWAQGSTSGTQYAAGATATITADTTFYAVWVASTWISSGQFVLEPKTWSVESGSATAKGGGSTQINVYGEEANVRTGKFAVSTLRTLTFNVTYGENDTNGIARLELHDQNNARITALDSIWNQNGGFTKTYTVTIPDGVTSICFFASMKNYKWWIINSAVLS